MTQDANVKQLIGQALQAWQENRLSEAHALALRAWSANPSPEAACIVAAILHAEGLCDEARRLLTQTILDHPASSIVRAQLGRLIKMDRRSASDEAKAELAERRRMIGAIRDVLDRDAFFKPSEFWELHANKHERMLDDFGIGNFKRSVAHNYQNWLISYDKHPQWIRLREIWAREPTEQPLLNTVENVDDAGFIWEVTSPLYALSNPMALSIYSLAVGILWEYALRRDRLNLLKDFEESPIGNPIGIRREGKLISQDAAHSALEMNALFHATGISATDGLTVAELGAGQGRLAEMLGRTTNFRYMIFDIHPALCVSQ